MIFIPFTMGSTLRSRLQNEDDRLTRVMRMPRIRYVENPGRALADTLVEKDPWYRLGGGCSRAFFPICYWAKGKGIRCTKEGICYKLECLQCRQQETPILIVYIGETSRSGRERVLEHLWLFKHKKESCPEHCTKRHKCSSSSSVLWEHSRDKHGGQLKVEDWEVTLTSSHRGALSRQVTEACRISNEGIGNLLNRKNEYGANNMTEMAVVKGDFMVGEAAKRKREVEITGQDTPPTPTTLPTTQATVKPHAPMKKLVRVAPLRNQLSIKEMWEHLEKKKAEKRREVEAKQLGEMEEEERIKTSKRLKLDKSLASAFEKMKLSTGGIEQDTRLQHGGELLQ